VPLDKSTEKTAETAVRLVYLSPQKGFGAFGHQRIAYPEVNMPLQKISGALYVPRTIRPLMRRGTLHEEQVVEKQPWFATVFAPPVLARHAAVEDKSISAERQMMLHAVVPPPPPPPAVSAQSSRAEALAFRARGAPAMDLSRDMAAEPPERESWVDQAFDEAAVAQEQEAEAPAVGKEAPSPAFEAGLLSIPVNIVFDGRREPFSCVMLRKGEKAGFSFLYHGVPADVPMWLDAFVFLLLLLAATAITNCLWSGPTRAKIVYGIVVPLAMALVVQRLLDRPLHIDLLYLVPLGFLAYRVIRVGAHNARERVRRHREVVNSLREASAQAAEVPESSGPRSKKEPGSVGDSSVNGGKG
jgi:hypothetical protein